MTDLQGKVVLITGASRGIGASTGRVFAKAGAHVVLAARGSDTLEELSAEIGKSALAVTCDVSNYDDVEHAVSVATSKFGRLDVLVNNAGVIEPISHIASSDPGGWSAAIDINLKGVYYAMRAALPVMLKAGGGSVLTISSGAAHGPVEAWSHYCASKAGVAMMTRCLDKENADAGIRAIGLSPGTVATQMQHEIKASNINPISKLDWSDHIPADWPARALLWMCGRDADRFKGQEISLRDDAIRSEIGLIS